MPGDRGGRVTELLEAHLARYPLMGPEDLYKLLFQAVMGPAHALEDLASARSWLLSELKGAGPGPAEPLIDPIDFFGPLARVHLRPWRHAGLDPELLLNAFADTCETFRGSHARLRSVCGEAGDWLRARGAPGAEAFASLIRRLEEPAFPAVSHSPAYRAAYRPAYRVLDVSRLAPEVLAASDL